MTDNKELAYIFIRYISLAMINEKRTYIKTKNRKNVLLASNTILENLPNEEINFLETIDYNDLENHIDSYELSNAISKLSSEEKLLIFEKYVLAKKDVEIAKQLNISSQAISKRKRKTLLKIRKFFQE